MRSAPRLKFFVNIDSIWSCVKALLQEAHFGPEAYVSAKVFEHLRHVEALQKGHVISFFNASVNSSRHTLQAICIQRKRPCKLEATQPIGLLIGANSALVS